MDKNAIKKYAVWARRELISRVSQRAALYEITADGYGDQNASSVNGRLMSAEEKKQRSALIAQIKEKGYEQVMEEIAYIWFNRFSALRFMEVNGYLPTRIRVFTNDDNAFKPQILDEAINMEMDGLDMQRVYDLKNANDEDALFKYMIITQCNALSSILPGMFQRISDYTELLFPDNLLRVGSVVEQMIAMIPQEDWTDQVQIIGWLYQYYNTEPKDQVFANLKKNIKISKENIPAATQLFTPDWIVRYMVENSLGRLWLEGHPNNELKAGWKYYLDEAEQEPEVQAQLAEIRKEYAALKPEDILTIDPCQGSGHILAYMFDVLVQIYEAYGYSAREAASSIVEHNIWGIDIDERAAQLAYFSVMMKARQYDRRFFSRGIQPHVYAIQESNNLDPHCIEYFVDGKKELKSAMGTLLKELHDAKEYGSILNVTQVDFAALYARFDEIRNEATPNIYSYQAVDTLLPFVQVAQAMAQKYHVTVTNPPYMGSSNMGSMLSDHVKKYYPKTKYDLSTVFMEKTIEMSQKHGIVSMINIPVWMFLSSFSKMRADLVKSSTIVNMAHFGRGVFGSDFGTTAFCIKKGNVNNYQGFYMKLYKRQGEVESIDEKERQFLSRESTFHKKQEEFLNLPGCQIAYWIPDQIYRAFAANESEKLSFYTRSGLTTGDNDRFLKLWFEIDRSHLYFSRQTDKQPVWYPHLKGGEYRKWYGDYDFVFHYDEQSLSDMKKCPGFRHDGKEFFFKTSVTWSKTTAGPLSARINYDNTTFNTAGCCLFAENNEKYALAALNSNVSTVILSFLCPSLSYAPGDIAKVPILISDRKVEVEKLVDRCIAIAKEDWDSFETSWDFRVHPLIPDSGQSSLPQQYEKWEQKCNERFDTLKMCEEQLNDIFINVYGMKNEISPQIEDRDISVRHANLQRDIKSLISYSVGCMFGRYSLDEEGLVYAGGKWDADKYISFIPDKDAIIPICDDEYFQDDIVGRFVRFIEVVYGKDSSQVQICV